MQKIALHRESWLDPESDLGIDYFDYWNDEEIERSKAWYVLDGDFERMERYIESTGLPQDLRHCVRVVEERLGARLHGDGIDLAAGNLWAVPHLLEVGSIDRIRCLEYSRHRLEKLGPAVLEHYRVPPEKVTLVLGSFYDLKLPDESLDFAFVSQGFHHADRPLDFLTGVRRVLRPGGVLIIIGEHMVTASEYVRYLGKVAASLLPDGWHRRVVGGNAAVRRTLWPRVSDIHPPDPVAGDHYYSRRQYAEMFDQAGLRWTRLHRRGAQFQSFVLIKPEATGH